MISARIIGISGVPQEAGLGDHLAKLKLGQITNCNVDENKWPEIDPGICFSPGVLTDSGNIEYLLEPGPLAAGKIRVDLVDERGVSRRFQVPDDAFEIGLSHPRHYRSEIDSSLKVSGGKRRAEFMKPEIIRALT